MAFTALIAVITFTLPGYIASDAHTTGEERHPGTSMQRFSGSWATKQYQESTFTDSPLIEWTILQKTTDVFESSDSDTAGTETDSTLGSFPESTAQHYDYNDVTDEKIDDVTNDMTDEVTNDMTNGVAHDNDDGVTHDNDVGVTNDNTDNVPSEIADEVTNDVSDDVTNDMNDDVTNGVNDDVTNDMNDDVTNDMNDDVTNDMNDDVTNDMNDDVTNDMNDDVTNVMNDDVTNDMTDDVSHEVTSDTTHSSTDYPYEVHSTNEFWKETTNPESSATSGTSFVDTNEAELTLTTNPTETSQEYISTALHKFTDDCVYDISRTTGEIIFPDNDHLPRANSSEVLTCKWRIRSPTGPNIRLHFRKLELELGSEYLELAVGMGGNKATRLITGTKLPSDIVAQGTELWLTLKSRQKDGFTQLSLTFEETMDNSTFPVPDNTTCGGLLVAMEGNISSPGYPEQYSTNEECTWYIAAPAHSVIQISILEFKTEVYDQVRIGVGLLAKAPASRLLTLFGELMHERETIVPANSLWVNFYSDDTITSTGFFIQYKIIPRDICNTSNVFDRERGSITSVHYPDPYPINSECTWTILGHPGSYINMTFHDLRIQDGRDFVLVGQGKEVFDGPFTTYTGNVSKTFTLTVKASNAWLHFTSDHLMGGDGFRGFNLSFLVYEKEHHEVKAPPTPSDVLIEEDLEVDHLPRKDILIFRLTGVQREEFESRLPQFREELARIVNEKCKESSSCRDSHKLLRTKDVEVVSLTTEGEQLVIEVLVRTALEGDYAMDSLDYDELEKLFHSDLQTLDLQHGPGGGGGADDSKLPEWLIGVIVVVILLIVVFFAMVIYSLVKERKKQRAGSYGGNTSSASMCDEVEVGKDDGNIRITSFIVDNEKANGNGWVDTEASTLQRRPQAGIHGCMNPAFVDDDDQAKPKSSEKKKEQKSKENGKENTDSEVREKAVDVEPNTDNDDNEGESKPTTAVEIQTEKDSSEEASTSTKEESKTIETHEAEVNDTKEISLDNENQTQKDSSSESCASDKGEHSDLSTNL